MSVGYIQLAAAAAMIHGSRLRSCCPRTNACMTTTAASTAAARRAFRSFTVRLASTDESVLGPSRAEGDDHDHPHLRIRH